MSSSIEMVNAKNVAVETQGTSATDEDNTNTQEDDIVAHEDDDNNTHEEDDNKDQAPLLETRSFLDPEPDEHETRALRRYLKMYFYRAFKWKDNSCSFYLVFFICFLVEISKLTCVTVQMFTFGNDRSNFSDVVNRGDLTLRHLLLKDWDASWETLPFPPAQGDFAVYDIEELKERINFAVERYYNAPADAIGYYLRLKGDDLMVKMEYFDFVGFQDSDTDDDLRIMTKTFPATLGNITDTVTGDQRYTYDVEEDFRKHNLTQPIKRLLGITLEFSLHSVRVQYEVQKARCLRIDGKVTFQDHENNGQVLVNLNTMAFRVKCSSIGFEIPDGSLRNTSFGLGTAVIILSALSLLISILTLGFGAYVFMKTKQYMKKNYSLFYTSFGRDENDLPISEYIRFIKFWDILIIVADILLIVETLEIVFYIDNSNWTIASLDNYAVWLSIGCLLAWICMLRYFKFHNKFHLLFTTLYYALWDVITYLPCVAVLFVGFWVCGYVVLGPYNIKFSTPETTAENLFSMASADELYLTFTILEADKSGGPLVVWFNRIYIAAFVALFAIIVINILIAIFVTAYECMKEYYEERSEDRELSDMEKAIKRVLTSTDSNKLGTGTDALKSYLLYFLDPQTKLSPEEDQLRHELGKMIRISRDKKRILLNRPRTIQAFMEDEKDTSCSCWICSVVIVCTCKE